MAPPQHRQRRPQRHGNPAEETLSFGAWLRQQRRALDLTQEEFAQRVGCARITIRRIEADELKPSQQLAELLADHLAIPLAQRKRWLQLARSLAEQPAATDLTPTPHHPHHQPADVTLPPFLQQTTAPDAPPSLFVARKRELAQLHRLLDLAGAGQGRVAFVTGEAGSGKSTLVQEFARRAQQEHPSLVVASGSCQAFAGIGDPYLPFRELLALLTGDVETRWTAGAIRHNQAAMLWSLLPLTVPTLLADSPDLIDTLIPGAALLQRAQKAMPVGAAWVTQLATRLTAPTPARATSLQQVDLFAQTTRLLLSIARHHPLLLILDDLQWADVGSLHLLFHLGRHLAGSRILLLGLYRPADVALGQPAFMGEPTTATGADRHPLTPIVAELQRTFGDMSIDLQQADGRTFVQSLLDSAPHRLPATFATTLYRHTEGQALFTVEMLRAMQARGDLVQDEQGVWEAGATLDWETLPTQVEGTIGERIGRLSRSLQTLLTVAAVEGEVFSAETIAIVQSVEEKSIIHQLSGMLDKQHALVRVEDLRRLSTGRLSRYRFRHQLFQKYLYQRLDAAERATLHEAVGQALAQRYGEQSVEIAPHLARHFELAGQTEMAMRYLHLAGETAARLFANNEAADYYRRALAVATSANMSTDLIHFYIQLGPVLELDSHYEQTLSAYTVLEELARQRGDQRMELTALMAKLPIYALPTPLQNPQKGYRLGQQALQLARALHDQEAEAKILWNLSISAIQTMQTEQAINYGEQSLALARALQSAEQTALTLNHLGFFCYSAAGRLVDSVTALFEAVTLWRQLENLSMLSHSLASLSLFYVVMGKYQQGMVASAESFQIAQQISNPWNRAFNSRHDGYVQWEQGDVDCACQSMSEGIPLAEQARYLIMKIELYASLIVFYGELGAYERSWAMASAMTAIVKANVQNVFLPIIRGICAKVLAQLHLRQHQLAEAEHILVAEHTNPALKEMPGYFAWHEVDLVRAELAFQQEEYERALSAIEQWLADLHRFGIRSRLPNALHMQGKIYLALGDRPAAQASWQAARTEAEALGSRWTLWQILAALAQIETDAEQATQLRQQAQELIIYIADHISDAELRTSFLSLPSVKAVATSEDQ